MFSYYLTLGIRSLLNQRLITFWMILLIALGVAGTVSTFSLLRALSSNPFAAEAQRLFTPQIDNHGPEYVKAYGVDPVLTLRDVEALRAHNARLRSILSEHGWPSRGLVGEDGAKAAWLVLQHAILDPELMRGAVSLVKKSVKAGDTEPRYLASLVDRIRTLEGRQQLYGSQYDWDEFGDLNPLPIEDADNVDVRRASVGLEPLAERTRKLRDRAAVEGEHPPSDYWEYRRAEREWARLSGWSTTDADWDADWRT
jgi:hypothetical protein